MELQTVVVCESSHNQVYYSLQMQKGGYDVYDYELYG